MFRYLRQNAAGYFRANAAAYFLVILVFIGGVIVGALAVKVLPEEQKTELIRYLQIFFQGLNDGTGLQAGASIQEVLYNNIKALVLVWLMGFTIIGIPFVLFIIFTRGFVIGFTVGFLVNEYVAKGLLFALVSVLPHNFLAVPAILIAGVAAMEFSLLLLRKRLRNRVNILQEAIGYTLLCAMMMALIVAAGIVEVYVSPVFMKWVAKMLVHTS